MYGFISRYLRIIPIMRSFRSFWGCRGINHSQDKLISRGEPATDHPGGDLWKGASPQWWVAKVLALVIGAVPIALPLVMQALAFKTILPWEPRTQKIRENIAGPNQIVQQVE